MIERADGRPGAAIQTFFPMSGLTRGLVSRRRVGLMRSLGGHTRSRRARRGWLFLRLAAGFARVLDELYLAFDI